MQRINSYIFLIIFFIFCPQSYAKEYSIADLENLARQHVVKQLSIPTGEKVEVTASKQDPRTQIPNCEQGLQITSAAKTRPGKNITVKIICPGKHNWRQYIPVRVKYLSPVYVAKTQLEKGTTIDSDNIELKYIDTLYLRGSHFSNITALIGAKMKQRVNSGSPINSKQICIVCKNELVTLSVRSKGLELKTEGIALSSGSLGEQIRVRNIRSKRIVYGRVKQIGQVQINL